MISPEIASNLVAGLVSGVVATMLYKWGEDLTEWIFRKFGIKSRILEFLVVAFGLFVLILILFLMANS